MTRVRGRNPRNVAAAIGGMLFGLFALCVATPAAVGAVPAPGVTITGGSGSPYTNGAVVAISVGANSVFSPNSRIEAIECAAPKGVDPLSDATCDGNTAQSGTVLVAGDGSFEISHYTIYSLPNTALEETPDVIPVCNFGSECVLYVGQNQNDFTAPKVFSAPFTVQPTSGSTPVTVHHAPVPGAPHTGVSARVAAAGAGTVDHVAAATTPTSLPATRSPATRSPTTAPFGSSGSPTGASPHPSPAVTGSNGAASDGPFSSGALVWWLVVLAVLLILIAVVGVRWWRGSPR